jgi:hypothetical protein
MSNLWGRLCTEGTSENSCETCIWKTKLNVKFVKIAFRSKFHRIFKYMKQNSFNCHYKTHNILKMLVISWHVDILFKSIETFQDYRDLSRLSRPFKTIKTFQDYQDLSSKVLTIDTFHLLLTPINNYLQKYWVDIQ